jgi:CRISPR-associated protein Cmr2
MTDWLMKLGLGGVQRFIAQSRKTNDLRVGSRLISDLARAAGVYADEQLDATLMRSSRTDTKYWQHQIVLRFHGKSNDQIGAAGKAIERCLRDKLVDGVAEVGVLRSLPRSVTDRMQALDDNALEEQLQRITDSLEVYWVAVPINDAEPASLKSASSRLFRTYDDRRHTRTFQPVDDPEDEWPWICSLCGIRAAVLKPRGTQSWNDNRLLNSREKLCAVCAAKRADRGSSIRSTHSLARDRFFRSSAFADVRKKADDKVWSRVLDQLDELAVLAASGNEQESDLDDRFGRSVPAAFNELSAGDYQKLDKLSPYYAILLYDGDRMGEWFSGARFDNEHSQDNTKNQSAQEQLSAGLLEFAKRVEQASGGFRSELIYAGGDEGLILAPLDFALPWIMYLHQQWKEVR